MTASRLTALGVSIAFCVACGASEPSPAGSMAVGGASGNNAGGSPSGSGAPPATAGSAGNALGGAGSLGGSGGGGGQAPQAGTAGTSTGGTATGGQPGSETPPEGVPANYHVVYEQTFAEPASLADLVFANPTEWEHDAGGFLKTTGFSYQPPYRSPFTLAIVKAIQVGSFVMDAELLQTSPDGDAHRDMVLAWNFVSPSQMYYAHISTAHDGVAHNIHIVNNADRTAITTSFTAGYDWGRDVWKRMRVTRDVSDGSMAIYDLDGPKTPILAASDKTFTTGYVGFGSFDNTGEIRNVKVWAETSTPGAPTFFSPAQ